jgi:hypothetical protein
MSDNPISNPPNSNPQGEPRQEQLQKDELRKDDAPRPAQRIRTFLKGVVYYDNRRVSIECTIRDISDTGARVVFASPVTVPDHIELFIPQKQRIVAAQVQRREPAEIGVSFRDQRSGVSRRDSDAEIAERVAALEHEVAALRRIVRKLRDKVLPADTSDGI